MDYKPHLGIFVLNESFTKQHRGWRRTTFWKRSASCGANVIQSVKQLTDTSASVHAALQFQLPDLLSPADTVSSQSGLWDFPKQYFLIRWFLWEKKQNTPLRPPHHHHHHTHTLDLSGWNFYCGSASPEQLDEFMVSAKAGACHAVRTDFPQTPTSPLSCQKGERGLGTSTRQRKWNTFKCATIQFLFPVHPVATWLEPKHRWQLKPDAWQHEWNYTDF